ncbi:MAG: aminotransferase class I/II-fold pyridoxal phosphate-dependent enzyme [Gemmatimonadales bacterium]|nr:MAG: aminotransferase class I/II-fold pyridoxal phosphate-dependent enzyme [Gemmatimonadales bacterium]
MPQDRMLDALDAHVATLETDGTAKGEELIVTGVVPGGDDRAPRFHLEGYGDREFLRLNSNSYLGLTFTPELLQAEEAGARAFGVGPGAVRFISGSYTAHRDLEHTLARFHGRDEAIVFSSAYAAVLGSVVPLTTADTLVISDELNHNCIINAVRLSRPARKVIYPHLDLEALERELVEGEGTARRALVLTDGIFSMRGDHAPLDEIMALAARHDHRYPENVVVVADDSHGVGAFGPTGRGVEEYTESPPVDVLIGTLGKAFGVNGGYVTGDARLIRFLRESAPTYIYSNPITPGEAMACTAAVELVDSPRGRQLLERLRSLTRHFEEGLGRIGIETIPGDHPVVPLMIRDTARTRALVRHLFQHDVLVTGLTYPVVPRGDEAIRAQVNADHSVEDLDRVLEILAAFPN